MPEFRGNRGEWSEIYTMFRLIADRQLNEGDGNLQLNGNTQPIQRVWRAHSVIHDFQLDQAGVNVHLAGTNHCRVSYIEFENAANELLQTITSFSGRSHAQDSSVGVGQFISSLGLSTIKASAADKADINVEIYDARTSSPVDLAFTIKSLLGGNATLLNASDATTFRYRVDNISASTATAVNTIDGANKIVKRLEFLRGRTSATVTHLQVNNSVFRSNLQLIDSSLDKILGEMLLDSFSLPGRKIHELTERITRTNPLHYDVSHNHQFYEYKIKKFLVESAIGMMPATVWTGVAETTGGVIFVKGNGELITFYLFNRNDLENYLFENIKFDTPSSSRTSICEVSFDHANGYYFFDLTLQLRYV